MQQVEKTPAASGQQTRTGLLKTILNFDPRSPSAFIARTPLFRNNSSSKFHKELNESIESQVDLEILTPEEEESLGSCSDIAQDGLIINGNDIETLSDPRSPITELVRTPIIAVDEVKRKKEDKLVKKLADKIIMANMVDEMENFMTETKKPEEKTQKAKKTKNLIYEDDENTDRFSTPPRKANNLLKDTRTPLGCSTNTPKSRIPTSTPKSKKFNHDFDHHSSRIPVSAKKLH